MHRQSLGSPASKLQFNGIIFSGIGDMKNNTDNNSVSENHRKDKSTSSSSIAGATDEQHKSQKSSQQNSTPASNSSKLVHLIPILTFFCFLILYLSSHDPSPKDSVDVDENVGGGSMAIRSMRNLRQHEWHRPHRKFWQ